MKSYMLVLALVLLVLAGCEPRMTYDEAAVKINEINSNFGATMESYPASIEQVNEMISSFKELENQKVSKNQEQLNYALDYRILSLEAARLYLEGVKHGSLASTKDGFSCRPRPIIIESALLRNQSAYKSYDAVRVAWEFIEKYPEDAKTFGITARIPLFQNVSSAQVEADAKSDLRVINNFCPQNRTLEIYKEYLGGRGNYSKDFINNLSYDEAAKIWMQIRGFE